MSESVKRFLAWCCGDAEPCGPGCPRTGGWEAYYERLVAETIACKMAETWFEPPSADDLLEEGVAKAVLMALSGEGIPTE